MGLFFLLAIVLVAASSGDGDGDGDGGGLEGLIVGQVIPAELFAERRCRHAKYTGHMDPTIADYEIEPGEENWKSTYVWSAPANHGEDPWHTERVDVRHPGPGRSDFVLCLLWEGPSPGPKRGYRGQIWLEDRDTGEATLVYTGLKAWPYYRYTAWELKHAVQALQKGEPVHIPPPIWD